MYKLFLVSLTLIKIVFSFKLFKFKHSSYYPTELLYDWLIFSCLPVQSNVCCILMWTCRPLLAKV